MTKRRIQPLAVCVLLSITCQYHSRGVTLAFLAETRSCGAAWKQRKQKVYGQVFGPSASLLQCTWFRRSQLGEPRLRNTLLLAGVSVASVLSAVRQSRGNYCFRQQCRIRMHSIWTDWGRTFSALQQSVRVIETDPPPWYQALETTLIGTAVFCFCFGESSGNARYFEADPYFSYFSGGISVEDAINFIFAFELIVRAWANSFQNQWFLKSSSIIDLISCMPILDRVFPLTPSYELPLELSVLRSLRFVRVARLLKTTARVASKDGKQEMSIGLSVVKVAVSFVGTLSIAASLLWRVEGRNGLNPNLNALSDAVFYMLNVFTSQGAPFPVVSTEGKFVTSVAILVGLFTIPISVGELLSALGGDKPDFEVDKVETPGENFECEKTGADVRLNRESGTALKGRGFTLMSADEVARYTPDFLELSVAEFCECDAGVDPAMLAAPVLESDVLDFFTLLEDPQTADFIECSPQTKIKLAASLVRRKRRFMPLEGS